MANRLKRTENVEWRELWCIHGYNKQGIRKVSADVVDHRVRTRTGRNDGYFRIEYLSVNDFFETREEALAEAKKRCKQRLKILNTEIKRLKSIDWENISHG